MVLQEEKVESITHKLAPRLLKGRLLRGCNVHHRSTVYSLSIDLGAWSDLSTTDAGEGFAARFAERFGGLESLFRDGCLPEQTRSMLVREIGLSLPEALLEAILAVERCVACAMCRLDSPQFSKVVQRDGEVELVWEAHSAGVSRAASRAAFAGLMELLPAELRGEGESARDFETRIAKLQKRSRRRQWSKSTAVLALAARQHGIPHELLAGNYIRLGEGTQQYIVSESALENALRPKHEAGMIEFPLEPHAASDKKRVHRLLVVDGRLVSALRFDPPQFTGDGTNNIAQWIERFNADPRRNEVALSSIPTDERMRSALAQKKLGLHDVPAPGQVIELPDVRTYERGAIPRDVTEQVHPSVQQAAHLAAAEQDQAIVSVEFLTEDISRSCGQERGAVIATSQPPKLFLHAMPGYGRTREVSQALLDLVVPSGDASRIPTALIPTVLIIGERGTQSIARDLDRHLRTSREGIGLAAGDQATIEGKPVDPTSLGRNAGPEFLLGDPRVSLVIGAVSPRKIVERGLRIERSSVTAILDPLPKTDLDLYRAGVEVSLAATTDVVLIGADNPLAEALLDSAEGAHIFLVSRRRRHPLALRHVAAGGSLVLLKRGRRSESIELRRGAERVASLPVTSPRGDQTRLSGRKLTKALFTAGLAFALDAF